jgi:hypothetical protein
MKDKIVIYGILKKQMINCAYQKQVLKCDVVLSIDLDEQIISFIELGSMKKFKPATTTFKKETSFSQLEEIGTGNTYYLQLHLKNEKAYSFELTNSEDTGNVYFDKSILNR